MTDQLYHLAFQFLEQEPEAAARQLELRPSNDVIQFLKNTPAPTVSRVLQAMLAEYTATILSEADEGDAQLWLSGLRNQTICRIFRRLDADDQQRLLNVLSLKNKTACQLLLSFREDMVGAIVETDIMVLPNDMTAGDGLQRLKKRQYQEDRIIFVTDDNKRFRGQLSLHRLLRTNTGLLIGDIFEPYTTFISSRSLIRNAVNHPLWQDEEIAPVLNRQQELIGALAYSQLRNHLSKTTDDVVANSDDSAIIDILHSHGDSMRALLDTLLKARV